jgi:hypothetical protein
MKNKKNKITSYLRYGDVKKICDLNNLSRYHIIDGFNKNDPYIVNLIEEYSKKKYGNPQKRLNNLNENSKPPKYSNLESDLQINDLPFEKLKKIVNETKLTPAKIKDGIKNNNQEIIYLVNNVLNKNKDLDEGQKIVTKYREYIQILKNEYEIELKGVDKKRALAAGRKYYLALSLDDTLTLKDEQAIANDLFTMI